MLGNFKFSNPTKLYFGDDSLKSLKEELKHYGKNIMLSYGGGSIKANGIYDAVIDILKECGKVVIEDSGVMPNPTIEKVYDGVKKARDNNVDFILGVGGGSVCDYIKAVSVAVNCKEDAWEKYYIRFEDVDSDLKIIPTGCILTMVGTGSEMNGGAVITNHEQKLKIGHVFEENVFPKFAILNPTFTLSIPKYHMVSGIYDIMCHILEQYMSGEDDNTSDYIAEGLMRSLVKSSLIAVKNPNDYEARSNIMWTSTWALNTLIDKGKSTDWQVHMLAHSIAAFTDSTHGMTLSAISIPYYRHIVDYGLAKFKRFAQNVWGINPQNKTDKEIAIEGIDALKNWMNEIGVVMNTSELGLKKDMIKDVAKDTFIMQGGYKVLSQDDIVKILTESLKKPD